VTCIGGKRELRIKRKVIIHVIPHCWGREKRKEVPNSGECQNLSKKEIQCGFTLVKRKVALATVLTIEAEGK